MESLLLCLDIGTSSCKAVIFDSRGRERARGSGKYSLKYPGPAGHVEQSPDDIWAGVCQAIHQIQLSNDQKNEISAVTMSSQMSSHMLVGYNGEPLVEFMNWMDSRAADEAEELKRSFTREELIHFLGADLPVGPAWPIPKLKWLTMHKHSLVENARYIVQPKEWIIWKMTGRWVSDVSSLRGLVHQEYGSANDRLLQWAGVQSDIIPPLGKPHEVVGILHEHAAKQLGLPSGLSVVLGWNDLNAAVLGLVGTEKNIGFDVTGTSEHIGIVKPQNSAMNPITNSGTIRIPFINGGDLNYGVTSSGGFAFQWFVENIERDNGYDRIMDEVSNLTSGSGGLICLPYFNGERSPWWNPHARGVFFGLSAHHTRIHMARAVLEGVGYALRSISDRLGSIETSIRISGGSARNSEWNQIKANILGVPIEIMETQESGCLGAAILAAYGTGIYSSLEEASSQMIRMKQTIVPNPSETKKYEKSYSLFIELYHALEPLFPKIQA